MVATQEKKRYLLYQVGSYVRLDREQEPLRVSVQSSEFFFMPSVFCCWYFHPRDFTDSHQMSQHFNCEFLKQGGRKVTSLKSNRGLEEPPFEGRKRIR